MKANPSPGFFLMIISLDTETTGLDLFHGCMPFLTTIAVEDQAPLYWQWLTNPLTRKPNILKEDLREVEGYLDKAEEIVFQNAKYDINALIVAGLNWNPDWWPKVHDTLYSGHILASGEPHDLNTMALRWLGVDISKVEIEVDAVVKECRRLVRKEYPSWRIAREFKKEGEEDDEEEEWENNPETPSAKGKLHKWDMWLPLAYATRKRLPPDHRYRKATPAYACTDSAVTVALWKRHKQLLHERGLWKLYLERRKLVRVIQEMEMRGVTFNESKLAEYAEQFREEAIESNNICINLSEGVIEKLPKSGTTNDMRKLFFEVWKMEPLEYSKKTKLPKINKSSLERWELELSPKTKQHRFVKHLRRKRSRDTAVSYIESYKRFGVPTHDERFKLLHAHLNATGSNTLRFTHSNPNEANISKQSETNLRRGFGPLPGREWWSGDYANVELRIPAYEAGEQEMIDLFERPDDPPYFGSQHLLISHLLHPSEFEQCLLEGVSFKDRYKPTLYQWVKNGDFAVTYGAIEESGTADKAYHMPGAQAKIKARFRKIEELNQIQIAHARKHGFVWTVPDARCGAYPIQCTRDGRGNIKPTVPLNYHTQSTAMWAMCSAMIRCSEYLHEWNRLNGYAEFIDTDVLAGRRILGGFITMQIHDELVFDLPAKPPVNGGQPGNRPVILKLKELMEESQHDIGIPLKVSFEYHPDNWAKGLAL